MLICPQENQPPGHAECDLTGGGGNPAMKGGDDMKANMGKEITVRVRNDIGVLSQLCRLIADKGINILAVSAWVEAADAVIRMVTNDNLRVMDALREKHYNPHEAGVVLLQTDHKPGVLRLITEKLAQRGVDVHHLYATAADDQGGILVVLGATNNDQAVVLLNS